MTDNSDNLMCVPGQRLCLSDDNTVAGVGTYERQGYIFSMLAGVVNIRPKDNVNNHIPPNYKRDRPIEFAFNLYIHITDENSGSEIVRRPNYSAGCRRRCDRPNNGAEPAFCQMPNYLHRRCYSESCISWHFASRRRSSHRKGSR